MLGANVMMLEALRLFLGKVQDPARLFCELVEAIAHKIEGSAMFSLKPFAHPLAWGACNGAGPISSASRYTLPLKVILEIRLGEAIFTTNPIGGEFAAADQAADCDNVDSQGFSHFIGRQ